MFFASFDRCRIAVPYTAISGGSEVRACSTGIRSPNGASSPTDSQNEEEPGWNTWAEIPKPVVLSHDECLRPDSITQLLTLRTYVTCNPCCSERTTSNNSGLRTGRPGSM